MLMLIKASARNGLIKAAAIWFRRPGVPAHGTFQLPPGLVAGIQMTYRARSSTGVHGRIG
jgi:hypothetical protein